MSLRKAFLPIKDKLLALTAPDVFDVRPTKLTIVRRTWPGGRRGKVAAGTVTAGAGDTWSTISTVAYGSAAFADRIRAHNSAGEIPDVGTEYSYPAYFDETIADVPQRYGIKHVSAREVVSSGGRFEFEDVKIPGITPAYYDESTPPVKLGGFTPAELKPDGSTGIDIVYVLTGDNAGEYRPIALHTESPFGYDLVIRRSHVTP